MRNYIEHVIVILIRQLDTRARKYLSSLIFITIFSTILKVQDTALQQQQQQHNHLHSEIKRPNPTTKTMENRKDVVKSEM